MVGCTGYLAAGATSDRGAALNDTEKDQDLGPNRQVKELPVCVSEKAYFAKPTWKKTGFDLLQFHVRYKRDYLVPRLKGNGALDNRMASYADAMVATAGLLSAMQLPQVTQGYWTEHSERAVIPTGLSVLEAPPWVGGSPKHQTPTLGPTTGG